MTNPAPIVLIDRAEVERRVCLTKTTIYRLMRGGRFPKPAPVAEKAVRWCAAEIDAWLRARLAERDRAA